MIDQARLDRISLSPRPVGQRLFGALVLAPSYHFPGRQTRILVEGAGHLPRAGGAIYVMNHTDRYNYFPFQYWLWRNGYGFTATWVKGKYYEHRAIAWFMDACDNIPIPSKGYVLTKDFSRALGTKPSDEEYAALKRLCDLAGGDPRDGQRDDRGGSDDERCRAHEAARALPRVAAFLDRQRDYPRGLEDRYCKLMERVVAINREALARGLCLLIFPQGTRSLRLTRGHLGAAQIALHLGAPIIPVGCSGSDKAYPGNSPISRGGTITYRVGAPLRSGSDGDLAGFRVGEPFVPFTRSADRFEPTFRALTDLVMDRVNDLVDPEYRYSDGGGGEKGAGRFV